MGKLNLVIDSGVTEITFTDLDDHVFSRFRMNPTDINLGKRAIATSEWFSSAVGKKMETLDEVADLNHEIEEKISYILGYESSNEIFGEIPALTILPDGSIFAEHVVGKIMEVAEPAIKERRQSLAARAGEYTGKYESV